MPSPVTCFKLRKDFRPGGSVTPTLREQLAAMPGFTGFTVTVTGENAEITLPAKNSQEQAVLRQTLSHRLMGWRLTD